MLVSLRQPLLRMAQVQGTDTVSPRLRATLVRILSTSLEKHRAALTASHSRLLSMLSRDAGEAFILS